ncbi:hypothetical protein A0J61_07222 [Choanephora cucurbitarum]|uniref:Uncharacterized protein n=1 Tax=Choanephora cucurbitarum TaxID=101091 RepID=A0A1C7N7X9_9FUNG|nr:hypothetical protein A0J61_07222 [Choanephora cucurbitarum]
MNVKLEGFPKDNKQHKRSHSYAVLYAHSKHTRKAKKSVFKSCFSFSVVIINVCFLSQKF